MKQLTHFDFRDAFHANQPIFVVQLPPNRIVRFSRLRLRFGYDISTNKIRH